MKKFFKIISLILTTVCLGVFISCNDNNEPNEPTTPPENKTSKRTIVIYMIATNTLAGNATSDLNEISVTLQDSVNGTNGCRLLIYKDAYSVNPQLLEYSKGKNAVDIKVLKEYDNNTSSTELERMQEVFADVKAAGDADEYGLILWSHASGWANDLEARSNIKPLNFGDDDGEQMPIDILAEAIPADMFNFIYTDACYMAGIEIAYELKDKIRYFIGSATEIPADGMDYAKNIPCFFADNLDLSQVCKNTFTKYNQKNGNSKTCTISLTDCSELNKLAQICKEIHSISSFSGMISEMQRYKYSEPYLFYDLGQYMNLFSATEEKDNERLASLKKEFNTQMEKVVIYKAATPRIFNKLTINEENYSGLSTYIMGTTSSENVNETYYKTLSWYNDVISDIQN